MAAKTLFINYLINYYNKNDDEFTPIALELDSWNGYIGDDRMYSMDDFDELFCGSTPLEIAGMVTNEFNSCDNYFYFNGYGNLCSTDFQDYSDLNDEYFWETFLENLNHLDIDYCIENPRIAAVMNHYYDTH